MSSFGDGVERMDRVRSRKAILCDRPGPEAVRSGARLHGDGSAITT